jgi:hypothetical protein
MEWALKHTQINDSTARVDQDIFLELKFPLKFPEEPPLMRIIRPKFVNLSVHLTADPKGLSVSRAIEKSDNGMWNPQMTVADYISQIRGYLLQIGASVDMEGGVDGYLMPTVGMKYFFYTPGKLFFLGRFFFLSDIQCVFSLL